MISNFFFILASYKFLVYLECIRSYAWSFGHSDLDLSSVSGKWNSVNKKIFCNYKFFCHNYITFIWSNIYIARDIRLLSTSFLSEQESSNKELHEYSNFRKISTYKTQTTNMYYVILKNSKIRHLSNSFSYDMPATQIREFTKFCVICKP